MHSITEIGKRRIIVAGGAGFIGSHLCNRLVSDGYDVVCVDNLYTSHQDNIKLLLGNPKFTFVHHDVTEPMPVNDVYAIFNLACPASPVHYQKNPIATTKVSVLGTLNLLELAKENRSLYVQASTSEIYGEPLVHPQVEAYYGNVNPVGIRSCYDEGKRCAESLCMDYYRMYGIPVKIVRIFNTYGPKMRENDGRVVTNFIMQALLGKDITLYGDGNQTRSFQYVDDLVEALVRILDTDSDFVGPVNIGNPHEISVKEFADKIIHLTHSNSGIVFRPLPQNDPIRRCPDISLAHQMLCGWSPKVNLDEGLIKTIEYCKRTYL